MFSYSINTIKRTEVQFHSSLMLNMLFSSQIGTDMPSALMFFGMGSPRD